MSTRRDPPNAPRIDPATTPMPAERELIVVARPSPAPLGAEARGAAADGANTGALARALAAHGATMRPLFEVSATRSMHAAIEELTAPPDRSATAARPNLTQYFRVDAPDAQLENVAAALRQLPNVQAAYVKPPTYLATVTKSPAHGARPVAPSDPRETTTTAVVINRMTPRMEEAPATPDFVPRQLYLGAAPAGIDALFAATQPGGRGAGVRIVDVEGAWRFTHEDLTQNQGGVVAGTPSSDIGWRNHGTAVMGEFGGDLNAFGITGICPDANVRGISIFGGVGSAGAIHKAADLLGAGDIILIELHRPGPLATGIGQQGFIALEWWPDDYDAIRYAIGRGVIVVEAAGNGAQNLDDPAYDTPAAGFPAGWSNPFRRGVRDSGAILVGAGAPPPGTHGRDLWGPDRSRLDFSNFGAALDAQGWGREVTTTGYGDLQGGTNEDFWYTDQFSGTSSASPIVVGALGCVQGNRRARGLVPLNPNQARSLLRTTGSPQQDAPGRPATQRIGNRPNLRQIIGIAVTLTVPLFRYWNPTNTDHFYTTNWSELGAGRYGWGFEGIQCYVVPQQAPGAIPLYRYWNAQIGDHCYTTNWTELGGGRYGWNYEGVQCYVYSAPAADRAPLYRYWNAQIGDHFYTTNFNELGPGRYGWYLEGVQCYVATQVRPPELGATDVNRMETPTEGMAADMTGAAPPSFSAGAVPMAETPPSFATSALRGAATMGSASSFGEGAAEGASFATQRAAREGSRSITIRLSDDET